MGPADSPLTRATHSRFLQLPWDLGSCLCSVPLTTLSKRPSETPHRPRWNRKAQCPSILRSGLAAQTMKAQRITNWTRPLEPTLVMTNYPFLVQLLTVSISQAVRTDSRSISIYSWLVDYNPPVFPFCLSELHFLIPTFPGLLLLSRLHKDHGEQLCEFTFRFSQPAICLGHNDLGRDG